METLPTHISFEATLSSLFAPEIRVRGCTSDGVGKTIQVAGEIGGQPIVIIHALGCVPSSNEQTLRIDSKEFSFILAWRDIVEASAPIKGWAGIRSLVAGLYPFDSQIIEISFNGVGFDLSSSLHVEIPHYLTRYYKGTKNLQHVFAEGGRKPVSFMGGICGVGETYGMHLHYKSLDAYRRIAGPALTMASVVFLNLTAVLAGGEEWRQRPAIIFALLSINVGAFGGLAAIRVGSTQRSLLNLVRLVAVAWVVLLTIAVRTEAIPGLEMLVDAGLKACIAWLLFTGAFAFGVYPAIDCASRRGRVFGLLAIAALLGWVLSLWAPLFKIARIFGESFS